MNSDLKVGDRVKLLPGTWAAAADNPVWGACWGSAAEEFVLGTVDTPDDGNAEAWVEVTWDNGRTNSYRKSDSDLERVPLYTGFNVGDRVKLVSLKSKGSGYPWTEGTSNPLWGGKHGCLGTVLGVGATAGNGVRVGWDGTDGNKCTNTYFGDELEKVTQAEPEADDPAFTRMAEDFYRRLSPYS